MEYFAALLSMLAFLPCGATPVPRERLQGTGVTPASGAPLATVVHDLLTASANDFHADPNSAPAQPIRFRDVHIKNIKSASGEARYVMCGEFMPAHGGDGWTAWVPFATVNTGRHGQRKGSHAAGLCQRSSSIPRAGADLSSSLERTYDSPQ